MRKQICVYEGLVLSIDAVSCPDCNEYDGLMPLNKETLEYLDYDADEYENEGYDLDWK